MAAESLPAPLKPLHHPACRPGLAINDSVEVWVGELYRAAKLVAEEQARHGNTPNSCTLLPLTPSMLQPLVVCYCL